MMTTCWYQRFEHQIFETLPVRSIAFLYQLDRLSPTLVDSEHGDVRRRLQAISQQAADIWDQLASAGKSWPRARHPER